MARILFVRLKRYMAARTPAFSLIELGIVLVIIGVIAGALFKGRDILNAAKMNSVLDDVRRYKNAVLMYQDTYNAWPGDDAKASLHFQGAEDGNGDGLVAGDERLQAWQHLFAAESVSASTPPMSRFGGAYHIASNPHANLNGLFILLGSGDNGLDGLLTPRQAQAILSKAGETSPLEGDVRFVNGADAGENGCLDGANLDLSHDKASCVMAIKVQ